MFRWVEMSLEALSRIKYAADFKARLGQLPAKLSGLYQIIYDQIDETETYGRDVAIKTLKWLLCAQRLLSIEELLAAVYVVGIDSASDSDSGDESEQAGYPENDILRLCRNLVVLDSERKTFRFAHQSVREYLLGMSEYSSVEQHALATERCLDVYLPQPSLGSSTPNAMQQTNLLKDYAQVYWPVHYKHIEDSELAEIEEKMSCFLIQGSRTSPFYKSWVSSFQSKYGDKVPWTLNVSLGLESSDRLSYRLFSATSRPEQS